MNFHSDSSAVQLSSQAFPEACPSLPYSPYAKRKARQTALIFHGIHIATYLEMIMEIHQIFQVLVGLLSLLCSHSVCHMDVCYYSYTIGLCILLSPFFSE